MILRSLSIPARALTLLMLGLAACVSSEDSVPRTDATETVISEQDYSKVASLQMRNGTVLCGPSAVACPPGEPTMAGVRRDGSVALAMRDGTIYLLSSGGGSPKQIGFEKSAGTIAGLGGRLDAIGDSGWQVHHGGSPRRLRVDDQGRILGSDAAGGRLGYAGSSSFEEHFVALVVPAGEHIGDTVMARFEAIAPTAISGKTIASVPLPATRAERSDLQSLPPFFQSEPVWALMPQGGIAFSRGPDFSIQILDSGGSSARLRVQVRGREITESEVEAEASKFLAMMPANEAFRRAAGADVARRRANAPRFHPAVTALLVAATGRLLVRGDPGADDDTVRWDLLDSDLKIVGSTRLSTEARILYFGSDSVLVGEREGGLFAVRWNSWARSVAAP